MALSGLNFALTSADYTDDTTVEFPRGRTMFSAQVSNNAILYTLAYILPGQRALTWDYQEHHTVPALLVFSDPIGEGLPPESHFAGIKVRSASSGQDARVTVA